jgi:hypothetical protein
MSDYTTTELVSLILDNEPVALTDERLIEIAEAVALELRSRLPLDAIRQGDLPEELEEQSKARRRLYSAVLDLQECKSKTEEVTS